MVPLILIKKPHIKYKYVLQFIICTLKQKTEDMNAIWTKKEYRKP